MQSERVAKSLTTHEHEVCSRVVRGYTNKLIARDLGVSEGTIKCHLQNVYEKLTLRNRTELATRLMQLDAASART